MFIAMPDFVACRCRAAKCLYSFSTAVSCASHFHHLWFDLLISTVLFPGEILVTDWFVDMIDWLLVTVS
jgi:hypothetical protein